MPVAAILAIIEALAQFAPQVPEIINGVNTVVALVKSGRAPTAAEQAGIDAALDAAHKALQDA